MGSCCSSDEGGPDGQHPLLNQNDDSKAASSEGGGGGVPADGDAIAAAYDPFRSTTANALAEQPTTGGAEAGPATGTITVGQRRPRRAKKRHRKGTLRYKLHRQAQATLESGITPEAVRCPPGVKLEAWVAVHVVDFFNDVNALSMLIEDCCTVSSCPVMCAGDFTYLWADGVTVVEPMKVPAPLYTQFLVQWCDGRISDETFFPVNDDDEYPENFLSECKTMMKRLFRVYAHMYHSHFQDFAARTCAAHLNTCFRWFVFFSLEHRLVPKREMRPLQPIIEKLLEEAAARRADAPGGRGGLPESAAEGEENERLVEPSPTVNRAEDARRLSKQASVIGSA